MLALQILTYFNTVTALPDPHIRHACIELPFIHDYQFPEITAFKFFIHQHMMESSSPGIRYQPGKFLAQAEFNRHVRDTVRRYYQIPSTEYWNDLILDITLSQVQFTLESGAV